MLVGVEAGRLAPAALPAKGVLPVVVLEELWLGVLQSSGVARDRRHATFEAARAAYDALVGATARVLGVPVVTHDRGFEGMAGVDVLVV